MPVSHLSFKTKKSVSYLDNDKTKRFMPNSFNGNFNEVFILIYKCWSPSGFDL